MKDVDKKGLPIFEYNANNGILTDITQEVVQRANKVIEGQFQRVNRHGHF
jgi:hypothetical protein